MKRLIIMTSIIFGCWHLSKAQDMHFSQFNMSPMFVNPGLTGNFLGDHRAIMLYRNQWSQTVPFRTVLASYDVGLMKKNWTKDFLGAGICFFSDKAGDANMGLSVVDVSLAYNLGIDMNNTVSVGIQTGFAQRSATLSNLSWDSQYSGGKYDATLPSEEAQMNPNFNYFDASAGIVWNSFAKENFESVVGIAGYRKKDI